MGSSVLKEGPIREFTQVTKALPDPRRIVADAGLVYYEKDGLRVNYFATDGISCHYAATVLSNLSPWPQDDKEIQKLDNRLPTKNPKISAADKNTLASSF